MQGKPDRWKHRHFCWHEPCAEVCTAGDKIAEKKGGIMQEAADMAALFGTRASGSGVTSPIERLLNEFEAHEAKEEASLEQYRKLLGSIQNPVTRFILQLIVSDEEKHRAVIHAMIATLRGSLLWSKPEGSLEGMGDLAARNGQLRASTDAFIQLEKDGIRECKTLVKESSGYYHGVFKILLDSMIKDSEKHVELLEFLKEHLKEA
jgi:bacterioferritin (cytochrome b1)